MDRFSTLLGDHVQFSYTALDRIVLNGYIERLQRPENLVYFFKAVAGVPCIEPAVVQRPTEGYRAWVRTYLEDADVPLLPAEKGQRKEELVLPHYRRLQGREGIACVLSSMESGRTFVSYQPKQPLPDNPDYRRISATRKRFLHYYFYVLDPVMGPMSLRVATYLPFNITCYLNGHSYLAQRLRTARIGFRQEDNAILAVDDSAKLQLFAGELTPDLLRRRCDYWARRLAPRFRPEEYRVLELGYRYSMAQVELATDVVFKRSTPLQALFRRATELGALIGGADRTTTLFGRRITARYAGKLQTILDQRDAGHPVLRSYYQTSFVKQYEKSGRLLRTETCVNDSRHLDIGRRLEHLPELLERMAGTNRRCLELNAELLGSTVDGGELAALARPTQWGRRRIPGIKLHDDRLMRLLEVLQQPWGLVADWSSRELQQRVLQRHRLSEEQYRLPQLRYDLGKLRGKGLVERIGTSRRYRLTPLGIRLAVLLVKARQRLLGPLVALAHATKQKAPAETPSTVERTLRQIRLAFDTLCEQLALARAAA